MKISYLLKEKNKNTVEGVYFSVCKKYHYAYSSLKIIKWRDRFSMTIHGVQTTMDRNPRK